MEADLQGLQISLRTQGYQKARRQRILHVQIKAWPPGLIRNPSHAENFQASLDKGTQRYSMSLITHPHIKEQLPHNPTAMQEDYHLRQ